MKQHIRIQIILLLFLVPGFGLLKAQDDFGASVSVEVTKKIISVLSVSLEEEFRLRDNLKEADRFSSRLAISFKPWKF